MVQIRCVVERITYQNPENGYTVLKVRVKDHADLVPVVGNQVISGALDHDAAVLDIRVIPAETGIVLLIHGKQLPVICRRRAKDII